VVGDQGRPGQGLRVGKGGRIERRMLICSRKRGGSLDESKVTSKARRLDHDGNRRGQFLKSNATSKYFKLNSGTVIDEKLTAFPTFPASTAEYRGTLVWNY
jgi:hypothetical protein